MNFFKKPVIGNKPEYDVQPSAVNEEPELDDFAPEEPAAPQGGFGGVNLGASSIELKVVRPENFEDVVAIADHLLNRRTIVLNLEATTKEVSRRMIDFFSGVAYAIEGQIKRVANATYIITPSNVDVSDGNAQAVPQPAAAPEVRDEMEGGEYFADIEG